MDKSEVFSKSRIEIWKFVAGRFERDEWGNIYSKKVGLRSTGTYCLLPTRILRYIGIPAAQSCPFFFRSLCTKNLLPIRSHFCDNYISYISAPYLSHFYPNSVRRQPPGRRGQDITIDRPACHWNKWLNDLFLELCWPSEYRNASSYRGAFGLSCTSS